MAFESVYIQLPNGQRYGPTTLEQAAAWAGEGRITPECAIVDAQTSESRPIGAFPEIARKFPMGLGDVIIPKNTHAVLSYYVGIFSFVGMFLFALPGLIMGIAAIVLGVKALHRAKENPLLRGKAHAITGIICGAIVSVLSLAFLVIFAVALLRR